MRSEPVSIKVRLKVKTPTAVGTGETYTLFDYAVKEDELLLINFRKLVEKLKKAGELRRFKELLRNFTPFDIVKLQKFYSQAVSRQEAKAVLKLEPEARKYFKEKFHRLTELLKTGDRRRYFEELGAVEVREAIKNPLTGKAYIPGSSLKGAVRTSLLNLLIKEGVIDKERFVKELLKAFKEVGLRWPGVYSKEELPKESFKELEKRLRYIFNEIDSYLLCDFIVKVKSTDFGRDLMRLVKVSDLLPVGEVSTSVGRLRRRKRTGEENPLSLVEFVEPGALFEGTITIYPEFIEKYMHCPLEVNSQLIVKALRREYSKVANWEIEFLGRKFSPLGEDRDRYLKEKDRLTLVKVGFGAGALSKTFSDAPELRVIGNRSTGIRSEPTTISVVGSKPMGWCLLEVC